MNLTEQLLLDLIAFAEGSADMECKARVMENVARDSETASQLARIEALLALLRAEAGAESAPASLLRQVDSMLPAAERPLPFGALITQGLQGLAALLTFDSMTQPAFGTRDASGLGARQLLFNAEGVDIDVRVTPQSGAWRVSGQVLGGAGEGAVKLRGDQGLELISALNPHGEFAFYRLPRGSYQMEIVQPGVYVSVPAFGVGELAP